MAKPKPTRKPPTKPAPQTPSFDVRQAAQDAASLVSGKAIAKKPKTESMEFKHLREGVLDPGSHGLDKILNSTGSDTGKKSNQPFAHHDKQVGHNQTFGANVTRSGVPRRTAG